MDQTTLVDEQIADGKRLLDRFREAGFPVTIAGWIWASERGRWHLYVASPVVEDEGIGAAYLRIHALVRQMPQPFSIGPFDVKAIRPKAPLAEAMLDLHRRHPGRSFFPFGGSQFGGVEVEGVYIYPPVALPDQTERQVPGVK
jgi:hypothetical protein